jgi:hypothetical protein
MISTHAYSWPDNATMVVCERAPRYAIALRRLFPGVKLIETRHLEEAAAALLAAPEALLVIDVEARKTPQAVALLSELQAEQRQVRTIAGVAQVTPQWELLLREAGASLVISSPRSLERFQPWMRRHLARTTEPKLTLRERVWRRLPWPTAGSGAALDT